MTSYTPTLEDIAYLAKTQPGSFSSITQTNRSIANAFKHPSDRVRDTTTSAHYNDYLKNGGEPLTKSPIPPVPDADGDGILDPAFTAACPDCEANKPCCVFSGKIMDASDNSRKLVWPYVVALPERSPESRPPTTMLTIADKVEGSYLVSKLNVSTTGRNCEVKNRNYPVLEQEGVIGGDQMTLVNTGAEAKVGYEQVLHMSAALRKYIPDNFLYALAGFETAWAVNSMIEGKKGAVFTPSQCISDGSMQVPFRVIPLPKLELNGLMELGLIMRFTTAGITAKAEVKGNITGVVGAYEIKAKGSKSAAGPKAKSTGAKAPGLLGTMAQIIETMDEYVTMEKSSPKPEYDITKYASGVTLSKSLKFEPMGLKLVAKPSSPDLQLKLGGLDTTLAMGVQGKIDFIDAAAGILLTPAGARAVQEARARMGDKGNKVNAYVKADVTLSCDGELKHKVKSGLNITIAADGDMSGAFDGAEVEFGGSLKIKGEAIIAIHVEAEVWIVNAEAGANGSLHTGWAWEMRMSPKKTSQRQKRYYFEGLKANAEAYAKVIIKETKGGGDGGFGVKHTAASFDATLKGDIQVADIMDNIAASRRAARQMAGFAAPNSKGDWYEILRPTVPKVTDELPKWEDY